RDARVYQNAHAVPRAFLAGGQTVVGSEAAALAAVSRPGFDPRREVVTERPLPGLPAAASGTARIAQLGREDETVAVAATSPAVLVMSDVWMPGWHATING